MPFDCEVYSPPKNHLFFSPTPTPRVTTDGNSKSDSGTVTSISSSTVTPIRLFNVTDAILRVFSAVIDDDGIYDAEACMSNFSLILVSYCAPIL